MKKTKSISTTAYLGQQRALYNSSIEHREKEYKAILQIDTYSDQELAGNPISTIFLEYATSDSIERTISELKILLSKFSEIEKASKILSKYS